ncbi:MAG: phosphoglycerate kinase [Candidatus Woesebacteria bacterium]|nr:phosphoglycerate kinase [Candidatus Woesebacteria bacterium]
MINLPKLTDLDVSNKKVLLRLDLDTNPDPNDLRIKSSYETLDYLKGKASEIIILAHRGRPNGKIVDDLSLKSFQPIFDKWGATVYENLRFDDGEEKNDLEFAKKLASLGDVYINDAFASSHRNHASIVSLPKLLPYAVGFRFEKEVGNLSKVFNPVRPLVILISGVKKDKVNMIEPLSNLADKVLVGGRLPDFLGDNTVSVRSQNGKIIVGNLTMDKEDITVNTIEKFKEEIKKAKTIVLAGVLGKYEDEGHSQGTKEIFTAVANSNSFKIVGGGDSLTAIERYNLTEKFDWISVGGGAMLDFLVKKTLPGIEALLH